MKVTESAFTGYPVTDMPRARAFYEGVLGLKPASTFEHEGKHWIEYDIAAPPWHHEYGARLGAISHRSKHRP
jgi:catechol 2,3-dioxygenase-like lactoylglutathione lyase family enzyme